MRRALVIAVAAWVVLAAWPFRGQEPVEPIESDLTEKVEVRYVIVDALFTGRASSSRSRRIARRFCGPSRG